MFRFTNRSARSCNISIITSPVCAHMQAHIACVFSCTSFLHTQRSHTLARNHHHADHVCCSVLKCSRTDHPGNGNVVGQGSQCTLPYYWVASRRLPSTRSTSIQQRACGAHLSVAASCCSINCVCLAHPVVLMPRDHVVRWDQQICAFKSTSTEFEAPMPRTSLRFVELLKVKKVWGFIANSAEGL